MMQPIDDMIANTNFSTISEPSLLFLLGGGLIALAKLVRRSFGGVPLPKPHRMIVWIGHVPEE